MSFFTDKNSHKIRKKIAQIKFTKKSQINRKNEIHKKIRQKWQKLNSQKIRKKI